MGDQGCETCRFWEDGGEDSWDNRIGECHRNPPLTLTVLLPDIHQVHDNQYRGVWPETTDTDWCGEYKPREGGGG